MKWVFQNTSCMAAIDNADLLQLFLQLVTMLSKTAFNSATLTKLSYNSTEILRSGMFWFNSNNLKIWITCHFATATIQLMHIYATSPFWRYKNLAKYYINIMQITVMLQGTLRINTILTREIPTKGKKIYLGIQWIILLHASSIKFMPIAVKIWKEDTKRTLTNQHSNSYILM